LATVIRTATPEEAEAVAGVQVRSWRAAYAHIFPPERLAGLSVEERATMWRRYPPLVAEVDGEIVGFASVGPSQDPDGDGELYAIYVEPRYWGAGFGRELMAAAEQRLRELGHREAFLWVFEDNPRAHRFYEAAGWELEGATQPIEYLGQSEPEVRYRKVL
jgi:GNAT superfamily N-acetyltransferase